MSKTQTRITSKRFYLYHEQSKRFIEILDGLTIGRSQGQECFPDDDLMSRQHFRLHVEGTTVFVEDLGATNRTRVNHEPIPERDMRKLVIHETIGAGHQDFIFTNQNQYRPMPLMPFPDQRAPEAESPPEEAMTIVAPLKPSSIARPAADERTKTAVPTSFVQKAIQALKNKEPAALATVAVAVSALIAAVALPALKGSDEESEVHVPRRRAAAEAAPPASDAPDRNWVPTSAGEYWEGFRIEGEKDLLFLRSPIRSSARLVIAAAMENLEVFKRLFTQPEGMVTLPLGEQLEVERIATRACRIHQERPNDFPALSLKDLAQETSRERPEVLARVATEKAGPMAPAVVAARLLGVYLPSPGQSLQLSSAAISCQDPEGRRFLNSLQRAQLFLAIQTLDLLSARLSALESRQLQLARDKGSVAAMQARQLSIRIRAGKTLLAQMTALHDWLAGDDAGAALSPDELHLLKAATTEFGSALQALVAQSMEAYGQGQVQYPIYFPTIPSDRLEEKDFYQLSTN